MAILGGAAFSDERPRLVPENGFAYVKLHELARPRGSGTSLGLQPMDWPIRTPNSPIGTEGQSQCRRADRD
jgi:hypothetical protein